MTDINKLKLLINAEIIENRSYYALFNEGMKKGAEIAQSIILHQNRWRKVEEELPEVIINEFVDVLVRNVEGDISLFSIITTADIDTIKNHYIEWKPIE